MNISKLDQYLSSAKNIVIIGAMDGISFDEFHPYLKKYGAMYDKVVLVEPVPWMYEQLKQTYSEFMNFHFENVAISKDYETRVMVTVPPQHWNSVPDWIKGCSMFGTKFTNLIAGWTDPMVEPYKQYLSVECVPFEYITSKYMLDTIDVVKIDSEGADWLILQQIDLKKYKPRFVMYECLHLNQRDKEDSIMFCASQGYTVTGLDHDAHAQLCAEKI